MAKKAFPLFITALLMGCAFDFLFWNQSVGANFPIFLMFCLVIGLALLWNYGLKPARSTLLLIAPLLFFAAATMLRQEPLTAGLSFLFSLLCAGLLAVTYRGGRWIEFSLADYIGNSLRLVKSVVARPVTFSREVGKERTRYGKTDVTFPLGPVIRGFSFAAPILLVFTLLFASADLVFNKILTDFFALENVRGKFYQLMIILCVAYGSAGVLLHAGMESTNAWLLREEKPARPFLGFIEASVVLGSVVALFLLFVVIQFQYFFGGRANIGIEGFSYSEYARRGFNELVVVAFLSLALTTGLSAITRRAEGVERRTFLGLCAANAALVVVMLVSAWQRLALAIDWHGYSRLRLYPRIFIIWLGLLFVAVVALEFMRRERYFAFAALLASIGFAATLCLMNVDATIVRYNVQRELQEKHLNISHLSSLSLDAVPALAEALHNTHLPRSSREGAGAALLCFQNNDPNWDGLDEDWRSFNYSQWRADQVLKGLKDELKDYQVNDEVRQIRVGTPSEKWYDCALKAYEPGE